MENVRQTQATKCSSYNPHFAPGIRPRIRRRHSIAGTMASKNLKSNLPGSEESDHPKRPQSPPPFSQRQILVLILGFLLLCVFATPYSGLWSLPHSEPWSEPEIEEPPPDTVGSTRWWPCDYPETGSKTQCGWIL